MQLVALCNYLIFCRKGKLIDLKPEACGYLSLAFVLGRECGEPDDNDRVLVRILVSHLGFL